MRPVHYFSDEYLDQCRIATPEQILTFLERYRKMQANSPPDLPDYGVKMLIYTRKLRVFSLCSNTSGAI